MGLFGDDDKKAAENAALHAELDRLARLSLVELAEEFLTKAYGPGGPGAQSGALGSIFVRAVFDPSESIFGMDGDARAALGSVTLEGVQVLEHACLVRWDFSGGETASMTLVITRVGRQALSDGTIRKLLGA